MGVTKGFSGGIYYVVCYITSRDGGVTQGDFRWYRCRRNPVVLSQIHDVILAHCLLLLSFRSAAHRAIYIIYSVVAD